MEGELAFFNSCVRSRVGMRLHIFRSFKKFGWAMRLAEILLILEFIIYFSFQRLQTLNRRKSLAPPQKPHVSWGEYISSTPGNYPCLGRPVIVKESTKTFKATVAMVRTLYKLLVKTLNLDFLERRISAICRDVSSLFIGL